jgi:hypothetical protein
MPHGIKGVIRDYVMERDNGRCAYCHKRGTTLDHVIPLKLRGGSSPGNLVMACNSCNMRKDSGPVPPHAFKDVAQRLGVECVCLPTVHQEVWTYRELKAYLKRNPKDDEAEIWMSLLDRHRSRDPNREWLEDILRDSRLFLV